MEQFEFRSVCSVWLGICLLNFISTLKMKECALKASQRIVPRSCKGTHLVATWSGPRNIQVQWHRERESEGSHWLFTASKVTCLSSAHGPGPVTSRQGACGQCSWGLHQGWVRSSRSGDVWTKEDMFSPTHSHPKKPQQSSDRASQRTRSSTKRRSRQQKRPCPTAVPKRCWRHGQPAPEVWNTSGGGSCCLQPPSPLSFLCIFQLGHTQSEHWGAGVLGERYSFSAHFQLWGFLRHEGCFEFHQSPPPCPAPPGLVLRQLISCQAWVGFRSSWSRSIWPGGGRTLTVCPRDAQIQSLWQSWDSGVATLTILDMERWKLHMH